MSDIYQTRLGWLYILTHSTMPGICKIGATRKHPIQRARELGASTGVPGPYTLAYYRDFNDSFAAESAIHTKLASCRVDESREFFKIEVAKAIQAIDEVAKETAASQGLTGGTLSNSSAKRRLGTPSSDDVATPFAELFSTFDPNGPGELTADERRQCRALERALRK